MKAFVISIIAAALLALGAIAAACGGGDRLTLEEYFAQAQVISDDADEQFEALFADFPNEDEEEFFSNEENLPALKDLGTGFPLIFREFFDKLEELNPPSETEDAHDEALAAGREVVRVQEGFGDRIQAAESFSELEELFDEAESEAAPAQDRLEAACFDLEDIADANGIVVDFHCTE